MLAAWGVALACTSPLGCLAQAAPEPASPSGSGAESPQQLPRVEITSQGDDTSQRRASTTTKIIVGREEIDRFGDRSINDVLRRLPGVTESGRPGRGGEIRLRGLGRGYTQILVNGEPMAAGFSLESISPDQVERIEILRAPSAEYGTRAVAGTINIVLREGALKPQTSLRAGFSEERGRIQPGFALTKNDRLRAADPDSGSRDSYNASLVALRINRYDGIDVQTRAVDTATGSPLLLQHETGASVVRRNNLNANARVQLGLDSGQTLSIQPFLQLSEGTSSSTRALAQPLGDLPPPWTTAGTGADSRSATLRVNTQWNTYLSDEGQLELRAGAGHFEARNNSQRLEYDAAGLLDRSVGEWSDVVDRGLTLSGKYSHDHSAGHTLVGGVEIARNRREEARRSTQDGQPLLTGFGDNFRATSLRTAAYLQDEWKPAPAWAVYAGLRWERITIDSAFDTGAVRSESSVWTPLLQAVWKPNPQRRDQVRMSLTRSYRSPPLGNLIPRPIISSSYPIGGGNTATTPDRVGNPNLQPELATGVELGIEHYVGPRGLLSANLFHRRISDLLRTSVTRRPVSWAAEPRWVSEPRNEGGASTTGLELEAKFTLTDLWPELPAVSLRSNMSFFRSRVDGVPGPNNRLEQQPPATANLGADYRLRSIPITLGGNFNWTPAYDVQLTPEQVERFGVKRGLELYGVVPLNPNVQLRFIASNIHPTDYVTGSEITTSRREGVIRRDDVQTQWQVRLEAKL